jgi:penicillin V acylase-like amidase (Ntn superfamily)
MEKRKLPSELTPTECRVRAAYYREMAATAASVRDALIRLAERYDAWAEDTAG